MEEKGLLTPAYISPTSGRRYYDNHNVARVLQIEKLKAMGLGTEEIVGYFASGGEVTELLSMLDVLVDGRFVQAEHDISLRFRGSRNQRLLDVPKSLAAGQPVWWQDEQVFSTHTM